METKKGMLSAMSSFVMWGLLPIYWKQLSTVPANEILCHRMAWSLLFSFLLLLGLGSMKGFLALWRLKIRLLYFVLTACLLSANWLVYIWSVNAGYIVETSLGYYINPLLSVCLGVVFLKERMRGLQWLSVSLAAVAVIYLTWLYGHIPWIALSLAATFACYGLLRKISKVPPLEGLCLETCLLFLPALFYLLYLEKSGTGAFLHVSLQEDILLAGCGLVTMVPMALFCYGAQKIPLYLVGLLQYLGPSINLLLGILVYHESFERQKMIGFLLIWIALAIFLWEGVQQTLRSHHNRR